MRNKTILTSAFTALIMFIISSVNASDLAGLWQNDRSNVTVQIEDENTGIRAKRSDQSTWYRYQRLNATVYADRNGNRFTLINQNQIEWRENNTNTRIMFHKVNSRNDDPWNERGDRFPRQRDNDRWNDSGISQTSLVGRWYDRSNKERIEIESINDGYRVRTQHGQWEKYTLDKHDRIRSRSGNIIRMIDRDTLQMRSSRDRDEQIFIRQGNGKQHKQHGKSHGKAKGHDKIKHGKKSRG